MTLGNRTQYAEHIGASKPYVTLLGKQGRLVIERDGNGKEFVNFEATDSLIRNTTSLRHVRTGENAKRGDANPRPVEPTLPLQPVAGMGRVDVIFRQAQAQERAFNAKMAELEYRKMSGELISVADIKASYSKRCAGLKEALLQIPARMASVLAAETDRHACHDLLQDELYGVLSQLHEA